MKHAFSLVELSIVLVILGLLTGGILTGQNLIRAAELRSVTTEYTSHVTATNTFRDKYFALPGDMRNATDFWGSADGNDGIGADCGSSDPTGKTTCNGDGNGMIERWPSNSVQESFRFWQHLANAGLIEGTYTGHGGTGSYRGYDVDIGVNAPRSKIGNAGWHMMTDLYGDGNVSIPDNTEENLFWLGAHNAPHWWTDVPILIPEEAWNIDTKIDDGMPMGGKMITARWNNNCSNATASNDWAAVYELTQTAVSCAFIFKPEF